MSRKLVDKTKETFTVGGQKYAVKIQISYGSKYYVKVSLWERLLPFEYNRIEGYARRAETEAGAQQRAQKMVENMVEKAKRRESAAEMSLDVSVEA